MESAIEKTHSIVSRNQSIVSIAPRANSLKVCPSFFYYFCIFNQWMLKYFIYFSLIQLSLYRFLLKLLKLFVTIQ